MVLGALYSLVIEVLIFWMPVFYTFKFLMEKDAGRIPTILKFWCMKSCYDVLSILLSKVLDQDIFPIVNIAFLVILNLPPYEITQKIYNNSLGAIYNQNRQQFDILEDKIVKLFNKKTETLKNRIKDSTGDKIKGAVGDIVMATIASSTKQQPAPVKRSKTQDSDEDSDE